MPQGRDNRETRYRNSSHGGHDDRRQASRDDGYRNDRHKDSHGDRYPDGKNAVSERRSDTDFFRDRVRDDQHRNGEKSCSKDWHTEDTDHFPKHKPEEASTDKSKEGKRYQADTDVDDRSRSSEKKEHHWGSDEEVEELAEKVDTKEPCWSQQSTVSYPARSNYSPQAHQSYGRAAKEGNKSSELNPTTLVTSTVSLFSMEF